MRYSENFQGLFSCQTQVIQFSQQTKIIPRTSASISLQRFYFVRKNADWFKAPQTKKGARRINPERSNLNLKLRPTCSAERNLNSTSNPKEK